MGHAEIVLPNGAVKQLGDPGDVELVNESDLAPYDEEAADRQYQVDLRNFVISGGRPYILITVDPETSQVQLSSYGIELNRIAEGLREIADDFDRELAA